MEQAEGIQQQNIAPVETPPPAQEAPTEKLLKQSEVNELVGRVKHEAYSKGMRDGQSPSTQATGMQPNASGMGGMPAVTDDHVRQLIAEEAHRTAQVDAARQTLTNFSQQMGAGKGKYSDFDETVANLGDLKTIPHIVQLAAETGIAADVMYELGRNPGKVATLTTLAYVNPHLAKVEANKLAASIKANDEAKQTPSVNEPLSQMKASTVGTDNGSRTVSDLRKMSWAKG